MLKMSRNLFKVAIKKLTDDFNSRKNTCIIFNVHSKNKHIFVQKVHNKVIRKQCKLAGIYSHAHTHDSQNVYSLIHTVW